MKPLWLWNFPTEFPIDFWPPFPWRELLRANCWSSLSDRKFSVSTYLFVRCNNHKCVWHLCEEVTLHTSAWPSCLNVLWFGMFARGSFWYKCPCTWRFHSCSFLPSLPHLLFSYSFQPFIHTLHTHSYIHTLATHYFTSHSIWRQHLHFFRLGLTRDLVIYSGSDNTIPSGLSDLVSHSDDQRSQRLKRFEIQKLRILFTARRIQHLLQTRPRAKNPTHILVWKKKVRRLPADLLMIKHSNERHLKWLFLPKQGQWMHHWSQTEEVVQIYEHWQILKLPMSRQHQTAWKCRELLSCMLGWSYFMTPHWFPQTTISAPLFSRWWRGYSMRPQTFESLLRSGESGRLLGLELRWLPSSCSGKKLMEMLRLLGTYFCEAQSTTTSLKRYSVLWNRTKMHWFSRGAGGKYIVGSMRLFEFLCQFSTEPRKEGPWLVDSWRGLKLASPLFIGGYFSPWW